ncbi:hypothetical protein HanIR_Chr01g0034541 [Helianthus annuus]|nr:hypothetical protein HanIR_Chr01g0034541 [Helianthus annuus]
MGFHYKQVWFIYLENNFFLFFFKSGYPFGYPNPNPKFRISIRNFGFGFGYQY